MGIAVWLVPSEPKSALLQQLMARHPEPGAPHSFPHFHPHVTLANIKVPPPAAVASTGKSEAPPSPYKHTFHSADPHPGMTGLGLGLGLGLSSDSDSDSDSDYSERVLRAELLLSLREALPLGQRAVRVRFARVLAGDHYFRSIYAALVPSPELAQLRAAFNRPAAGSGAGVGRLGPSPDEPPAFPHLSLYYVADGEAHVRARFLQELEREEIVRHSKDGLSVALRCGGGGGGGVLEGFKGTQIWIVDCVGPVEGWKVLDKILLGK